MRTSGMQRMRGHGVARTTAVQAFKTPLVKVCGITNPEDAAMAAGAGADFIGMIMWQKAKRAVSDTTARAIVEAARAHNAQPVGVFVDESADTITDRCQRAGIKIAQLHGDGARSALPQLPADLQVIYVLNCQSDGSTATPLPCSMSDSTGKSRKADWLLLDGMQGGSGQVFDWTNLTIPQGESLHGWLLAGGLLPSNVATAVQLASPTAVDVSSGVCGPDGLAKDSSKVTAFIAAAKTA
ncbi:MAG: hypothetical protein WDW38_004317 [Sanguina aurantia]